MNGSIDKLQKYFNLEAARGYDNKAVFGGLDRMLEDWESEARVDKLDEDLIKAVVTRLRAYARLTPSSREEVLKGLWGRIRRELLTERETTGNEKQAPQAEAALDAGQVDSVAEPAPAGPSEELPPVPAEREGTTAAPEEPSVPAIQTMEQPAALDAPVTVLSGIGDRHAATLERLGLRTLGDMLYHFPRRYDDYSELKPINRLWYGEEVTVIGSVDNITVRPIRGGRARIVEAVVRDGSGGIRATWFNQPWVANRMRKGTQVVLSTR